MGKLQTIRVLADEPQEVFRSGATGEILYYSAHWEEIRQLTNKKAREQGTWPIDVRCAGYALDLLGIPNHHSEAEPDEKGNWIVYWR